ncbi:MAG: RNA polymerase sigma-70 factor [Prevotella sp.]|jgi:RNA polymerase sigma-70 factor (ECF subfamily)|nr:RNA polymerase sigma-70 factor [Prevotella sp.]MCH4183551.1 RNA polymerase sigma-70 factor [Prevotella sp.]MCH4211819.1 RNA polymerase sigma-70 factor [Prevotella sp.]MCH4240947.1 RNA polymerase sigma-70 factor [Prevotella sp.]
MVLVIEKINERDEKNWEVLFDLYYAPLCCYATDYLHDFELAKDIVQETLLNLWVSDYKFDSQKHLTYYLYKAIYNNSLYHLRKTRKHVEITDNMNQQLIDDSFSDTVKEELVRRLYEEIQKLPERRRQIMLLSIDGKSGKEIAEMLNISVNTVKAVKAKAMDSLRKATKDNPILFFL